MWQRLWQLAVLHMSLLSAACHSATSVGTGPSAINPTPTILAGPAVAARQIPSLIGRWRASGASVFRNLETGSALNRGTCSGSLTVDTQNDERFTGQLGTQGSGWNSDRFCTASGTVTGELLASDGRARAWLEGESRNWPRPSVSPSCEFVSVGDGIWSGSATGDAIRLQISDTLRCPVNLDGGVAGTPMADFERTVALEFQRW